MSELESVLHELFDQIEILDQAEPPRGEPSEALMLGQRRWLVIRRDALSALRSAEWLLTQSALADRGPSRRAAEELLLRACIEAAAHGAHKGLDVVAEYFAAEPSTWIIAEPASVVFAGDRLRVGACVLIKRLDESVRSFAQHSRMADWTGPCITTEVTSREEDTAYAIAAERFGEAFAILNFADAYRRPRTRPHLYITEDGNPGLAGNASRILNVEAAQDRDGNFGFGLYSVSEAAAINDDERTDWQRRTLGALRWYARGKRTTWSAEALFCYMTVLETLLIGEGEGQRGKGNRIAERVTARLPSRQMQPREQKRWLRKLYLERNKAVHQARPFFADKWLPVLEDFAHYATDWAIWHVAPNHVSDQRACETLEEVTRPDHP